MRRAAFERGQRVRDAIDASATGRVSRVSLARDDFDREFIRYDVRWDRDGRVTPEDGSLILPLEEVR